MGGMPADAAQHQTTLTASDNASALKGQCVDKPCSVGRYMQTHMTPNSMSNYQAYPPGSAGLE